MKKLVESYVAIKEVELAKGLFAIIEQTHNIKDYAPCQEVLIGLKFVVEEEEKEEIKREQVGKYHASRLLLKLIDSGMEVEKAHEIASDYFVNEYTMQGLTPCSIEWLEILQKDFDLTCEYVEQQTQA